MIYDLVTKLTYDPYRMFTSRSEHRLLLLQDNVYFRLLDKARQLGIVEVNEIDEIAKHKKMIQLEISRLENTFNNGSSLAQLLRRPESDYLSLPDADQALDEDVMRQVEIGVKYAGYIRREKERAETARKYECQELPRNFNYHDIKGLRHEACEKLVKIQPENIGQASRISGVNPADISILLIWLKRHRG